jgi:catechol 2,3-dioxygenase-like lactoylglutathione lyase family enzyme
MPAFTFEHIHLVSADATKAAKWYENVFGAKIIPVSKFPNGRDRAEVSLGGFRIQIRSPRGESQSGEDSPMSRRGIEHLGIRVDNMDAAVERLKSKGVALVEKPRISLPSGCTVAFLMAPDNVMIELLQFES